jgi:hypothetical protein
VALVQLELLTLPKHVKTKQNNNKKQKSMKKITNNVNISPIEVE